MGKVKISSMNRDDRYELLDELYNMISILDSKEEVKNFFRDLLTPSESLMLARRIAIARMLIEGATYDEIKKKLSVGYDNIKSVYRWLYDGFGGYNLALEKISKTNGKEKNIGGSTYTGSAFDNIRRKYPAHFLLVNAFLDASKKISKGRSKK
jgi:TrpR-related protein YerC/YecD